MEGNPFASDNYASFEHKKQQGAFILKTAFHSTLRGTSVGGTIGALFSAANGQPIQDGMAVGAYIGGIADVSQSTTQMYIEKFVGRSGL